MALDWNREIIARWSNPRATDAALLHEAGITAVLPDSPDESFSRACREAGLQLVEASAVQFLPLAELEKAASGSITSTTVALKDGLWPGIARQPTVKDRDEVASASMEPWVDSNGYWAAVLKTLYPSRPVLAGYAPPQDEKKLLPFDSLELALIEARVNGGNFILSVEPRYRKTIEQRDAKALEAWKRLGVTARWLKENHGLFQHPASPIITALVEPETETPEIANLLFRRNASPALEPLDQTPPPDPSRRLALVAANTRPLTAQTRARILAHAEAGTSVISNMLGSLGKPVRSQEDRDFYKVGRGEVVAYRRPIADPSDFAMDVIDVVTHRRRAVRLWNAPAAIARVTLPAKGGAVLTLINYGDPREDEVQVRVHGKYTKATRLGPDGPPAPLKTAQRGATTEVFVERLRPSLCLDKACSGKACLGKAGYFLSITSRTLASKVSNAKGFGRNSTSDSRMPCCTIVFSRWPEM